MDNTTKTKEESIDEENQVDTTEETPKQRCEKNHVGQAGYCQTDGTWVPAV